MRELGRTDAGFLRERRALQRRERKTGENGSAVCWFCRKQNSRRESPENAVLSQGPPPVAGEDLPDGRSLPPDRLGEKMAAYGVFGVVDGLKQAENSVWR